MASASPILSNIARAAQLLKAGGLVAFPTETVYGLGAVATDDRAVARIYAAKGRPNFNPLIVHVPDLVAAERLGQLGDWERKLAAAFWPGPLTLVVERVKNCPVSLLCSAGLSTLALRVPSHPLALDMLRAVGVPVAAPSANASGRISPTTAQHVRTSLGGAVDMILDGGACQTGVESTVVRIIENRPTLLRAGGVPREAIEHVLGLKLLAAAGGPVHSPGQLESHYAPRARLRLNAVQPESGETYIGFGTYAHGPLSLSRRGDTQEAASNLFRLLHEVDAMGVQAIAIAPIPMSGLGEAINDRLLRAAAPRPMP
jgi:L-threonylcarbamoyladenylate synthase